MYPPVTTSDERDALKMRQPISYQLGVCETTAETQDWKMAGTFGAMFMHMRSLSLKLGDI
jgi:hypothetical protein